MSWCVSNASVFLDARVLPVVSMAIWIVFGVIAVLTMWVMKQGLKLSHRYVGPLERLERELMKTNQPNLAYRLHCRPGDVISPIIKIDIKMF